MTNNAKAIDLPDGVMKYLSAQKTLTLATASSTGAPHAATLVYVNDGVTIYFSIRTDTRTAQNIAQNPAVAFTIDEYSPDWKQTEGIQGSGECAMLLDAAEIRRVHGLFRAKFPFLRAEPSSQIGYFRVRATQINYIHNEGTAAKDEIGLDTEYDRQLVYSIFRELPREKVEALTASLEQVRVAAGELVVRQGAPADKFFIIVDGEVEVVREGPDGPHQVAKLEKGQFFGEIGVLRDRPRTASVRALVPTTLMTMPRETFRNLMAGALATTQDFDRIIQERLKAE